MLVYHMVNIDYYWVVKMIYDLVLLLKYDLYRTKSLPLEPVKSIQVSMNAFHFMVK